MFAKEVKISDSFNIAQYIPNLLCFEKLNTLPLEKLTDALFINLQTKRNEKLDSGKLFNLINQLEFLNKNSNLVMAHYEKYCKANEQLRNEWNKHLIDLTKNIAENRNELIKTTTENRNDNTIPAEKKKFNDEVYKFYYYSTELQKKIADMQNQKTNEGHIQEIARSTYMNNYITPVYKYGLENSDQLAASERIQETMIMLKEVKNVNSKYIEHRKYGDHFEKMNGKMIESKKILFESIEYYETHDVKSSLKIT